MKESLQRVRVCPPALPAPGASPGVPGDGLAMAFEIVAMALEHEASPAAATAVMTELATRLGFERVSLGFLHRGLMRVEAISHSASFDERANLVCDLASAMDEAADQDATISHPAHPGGPVRIARAHAEFMRRHDTGALCTVPIASRGRVVGAVTYERALDRPVAAETLILCERITGLVGSVLHLLRARDLGPLQRTRERLHSESTKLFGPDHPTRKLIATALGAFILFFALASGEHRITAEATLEGRVQRAIVAGVDGFIAEADARAGDLVRQGDVLGQLDERDLRVEERRWSARGDELRREYREAKATHDRAQMRILDARLEQAEAQLRLVKEELSRTRLTAPFDGVVVKGDLSRSLGSPVAKGDVLFELAPLDGYRIVLEVDQTDIAYVAVGRSGQLALSALSGQKFPFTVNRITPIAIAEDGRNYFRVEARLDEGVPSLRPGMAGVAKLDVERRRLAWIWTHELFDWLRLWAWSFWP